MKQISFASASYEHKKIITKREKFLNEMDQLIPWSRLIEVFEPHYPKGKGRPPMPLETMLRIYYLQQWYSLSDPACEETLYDIPCMRGFAQLDLIEDAIPDETTILKFRHLLESKDLTPCLFTIINTYIQEAGVQISQGTMVDATIIGASGSTKNKDKQRDPEMRSTCKNKQYYFGMKIHIGADINSGLIHTGTVTAANQADITELPNLIGESDNAIMADAGYTSDTYKRGSRKLGIHWLVNDKRKPKKNLSTKQKKRNRKYSKVRARVAHCFRVIKCQFGYKKVRYKGLEKNTSQVFALLGLANLYMARKRLVG